ncbi:MAG: site-specific DNA-methyltransferase [Acidobacteria bacterium]|nr:site-specific DNA-methyltransferase [Acidobacteriota bacterium]
MTKKQTKKIVETIKHEEASRRNIPTAEYEPVMRKEDKTPVRVAYTRRNHDLDPQLVWRGKDEQDWSDLVIQAPPIYIQEKVHPKVLIDDLFRRSKTAEKIDAAQPDLFADFNGLPDENAKTEFYKHDANWANRMILGDSLQVMASLAEREGLRGKVQCIYIDPPYGIKFNSNFQWSTTSRDVKDGNTDHITREPEQVKAFRDTWRDGIHSYLTYLRDRLTVARDLLTESGSIFVQIGDENVHRVRAVMDEIFGEDNFVGLITFTKTSSATSALLPGVADHAIWFAKNIDAVKYRQLFIEKELGGDGGQAYSGIELPNGARVSLPKRSKGDISVFPEGSKPFTLSDLTSQRPPGSFPVAFRGETITPRTNYWKTGETGFQKLIKADRVQKVGSVLRYIRYFKDFSVFARTNIWTDVGGSLDKSYVVETNPTVVQRCLLMTSDPGDLVLDPTCGSGTTTYVAEQWGRRWITIDTSRVALALARARIMGARYAYYLLADSPEGQLKEAEITQTIPSSQPTRGDIRQGFVYERVPHITLKSIANNAEIDVIWEKFQQTLEPLRNQLNAAMKQHWEEWEIPREAEDPWSEANQKIFYQLKAEQSRGKNANSTKLGECLHAINHNLKRNYTLQSLPDRPADPWPEPAQKLHAEWWEYRIARQKEIDASIAAKAEFEYLYDKPYPDPKIVRVAGPFTVESLSPHRVLAVNENDELIDGNCKTKQSEEQGFIRMILESLKSAGVQQAHKEDKINFVALTPWPGDMVCAEGRYEESGKLKRAAIFVGPEFGTVSRPDLVAAAREAGDADFDVLITCAFNYDAHSSEFSKLGRIPVLKARMNADLHMADDLKNTGKGNLFVIFGEPDIDILKAEGGQIQVKINGVDVFHPSTGEVRSDGAEGIACWFIDTDYNEESFFVRHAYFLGANDPYKALKTTLKAEINEEAWATLHSNTSRPFDKPTSGRIAVKVINHLGDEVMKVFQVK